MDFFVRKPFLSLQLQPRNEEQQSKNNRKEGEGVGEREGEELKGDTANPMLSQKPSRRKTFAPKYPILHTLPTHGSEDCSINVYKQGAYACSLYHPAGNCILCFPNNSILPKNAAANNNRMTTSTRNTMSADATRNTMSADVDRSFGSARNTQSADEAPKCPDRQTETHSGAMPGKLRKTKGAMDTTDGLFRNAGCQKYL